MSRGLTLVVPMPPHVTNRARGSTHWRRAHAEKAAYWEALDLIAGARAAIAHHGVTYQLPAPPAAPYARVQLRSTMYLGGAMDDDNALARHKPLLDYLRARGYLVDDRKRNVEWEGLPAQIVKRDGRYRIELVLTPLAPGGA